MQAKIKRLLSWMLVAMLILQLAPARVLAEFDSSVSDGDVLFYGENNEARLLVSETAYPLAKGVVEYVSYTNETNGMNQNIDYFCEIDLSQAKIMAGYPGMDKILSGEAISWEMKGVSEQVRTAQTYFDSSTQYQNYKVVAALNGDYYNMATGEPIGALVINGQIHHGHPAGRYYFAITDDGEAIISNNTDLSGLQQAVAGSTLLVNNGNINVQPGGRNVTYTAIGIKADGNVVAMVSHGQSYPISCGYTQYEVAQMMKARGCIEALLLDGSGSSTYVSRHEGESDVTIRNSPSDGQERMTSSSIMIISTDASDGVFDHAVITPNDLVYTPGSRICFEAIGADKSGSPAALPSGVHWSLADASFGTIDSNSGVFVSGTKTGEVTVNLEYMNEVVGSATVLIETPDQLLFSAAKVSVGFGETSALGFQARYRNREVHYNSGDFQWELSDPEMGTFTGNLFTAHLSKSFTGTAKVTSRWDEAVTATVELEVGKLPLVAMDFETPTAAILHGTTVDGANDVAGQFDANGSYTAFSASKVCSDFQEDMVCLSYTGRNGSIQPQVGKAAIVSRADGYPVRFGEYALKLDYDFRNNANATDGACFGYNKEIVLEGNPTKIGVWVYIPEGTPSLWLRLRYRDGSGNTSQVNFTEGDVTSENSLPYNADNAWHYFEANISHLQTPVSIPAGMAIRVMVLGYATSGTGWTLKDGSKIDKSQCYGSLYFDDLTYVFGSTNQDTVRPVIRSVKVNQTEELTDGMTLSSGALDIEAVYDDSIEESRFNTGVARAALYVDGQRIDSATVGADSLRAGVRLTQGRHIIRLSVSDNYGNESVRTYHVQVDDPAAEAQPVYMTARDDTAVVGGSVTVDFTPASPAVTSMEVTLSIDKDYKDGFTLTAAENCSITRPAAYDAITNTISFAVEGTVSSGPMASLHFQVPATAIPGTRFACEITSGVVTCSEPFDALPSFSGEKVQLPVAAPYTVTSGTMVAGVEDTLFFAIYRADGTAATNVGLYKNDGSFIGSSDNQGRVAYVPAEGENHVRVYAKDGEGNLSGNYTATVYVPQGNNDGTPTHVWHNAADAADSLNVSWMSNPLYTDSKAVLQLAKSEAGIADGQIYTGKCELVGFERDGQAANICGVKVTGLAPGSVYYYRVGDGKDEHWSDVMHFTTGYANTDSNILILGDLQESNNSTLNKILEQVDLSHCDLTIQTGDLVDAGGSYTYWDNTLAMLSGLDTDRLFSLGNHEAEGGLDIATVMYNQANQDYYSVEYGNTYIASIAHAGGSAGYENALEWLVEDAKKSNATWKILVTHQPAYYTNPAGGNESAHALIPAAVQEAGIDIVLSGHDHSYARTQPLWDGAVDADKGITYFICGSLGEKSYTVVENPNFHFAKTSDAFNAVYLTLSTTSDTLTVNAYDYKDDGSVELLDSFTKTKTGGHTHDFVWDGADRLSCACGYNRSAGDYSGYATYDDGQKSGSVYLHLGQLQTGVFAAGSEVLHTGADGFLHNTETVSTATCTEDGYLGCLCHDCNTFYQLSERKYLGHQWDENHVCTREVYDTQSWSYKVCGYHGRDISKLEVKLGYLYGFYSGEEKRPKVTITDTLPDGTRYTLLCQSTYGDCMPYYIDNVEVGRATIRIEGYGNYYGEQTVQFDIVPNNVKTIEARETTSNSVTLGWEAPLGAGEYIVYQLIDGKWTRLGIISETTYTVTGLTPGEYQFRIRPCTDVDGEYFYSTQNSDILTVSVGTGEYVSFTESGNVTKTYGDVPFVNLASFEESSEGFAYTSSDPAVASVDAVSGEVTILKAGTAIITAEKGELAGQYRLTVAPKTVGLVWSGEAERTYDGTASAVTVEVMGLLEGDGANVTVTDGDAKDAGTYTARAVALDNPNYALPEDAGYTYTILPVALKITWSNTQLTYSGREQAPAASAGEGLVGGDSVAFNIKGATEPGTYRCAAVSRNPNYVVAAGQETMFTIDMPAVRASGAAGEPLTCYMEGSTIYVVGCAAGDVTVTVQAHNGSGSSATVSAAAPENTITLSGVTYTVDASGLFALEITLRAGGTVASAAGTLDPESVADVEMALAPGSKNGFENILAAVAGAAETLTADAAESGATELVLLVSMQLEATDYTPAVSYTVHLQPMYMVGADGIYGEKKPLDNAYIHAPVLVTLQLPASITPDEHTYIRHSLADNTVEYIRPVAFNAAENTVSFLTKTFSAFTVYSDTREADITFNFADGSRLTQRFGPEQIGQALPTDSRAGSVFKGWTINGAVYTTLDEVLLELDGVLEATPSFATEGGGIPVGSVNPEPEEEKNPFEDVDEQDWFYEAVLYAHSNGLFLGTTDTRFSPDKTMTRAMLVTVLHRLAGEPDVAADNPFGDVPDDTWYTNAVLWAAENGIVKGYGDGRFGPDNPITREQLASILHGYTAMSGAAGEISGELTAFQDAGLVSGWAADALRWAVGVQLLEGKGDGRLDPRGSATRAEVATVLMRYCRNILKLSD